MTTFPRIRRLAHGLQPPGVAFIAALLREHAVPRRGRYYPSFHQLLAEIDQRWPGLVDDHGLHRALDLAGLRIERLQRPKGARCLSFELDQPVSEWKVPRPAAADP